MSTLYLSVAHETRKLGSTTRVRLDGLSRSTPNEIFYEVIGPDAPVCSPDGNFAFAAALPTAMASGLDLHYDGSADGDFLRTMEEYMAAWCRWCPDLFQPIRLSATTELPPAFPAARSTIMAFSGGLDSTFALHAHKRQMLGRRNLDVTAAVLIQGFDIPLDNLHAMETARAHIAAMLDSYDVRLNIVRTNWQRPFSVKWGMTHVLGIAAILHLFQRQFASGLLADDTPYDHQLTPWSSNAITNQMLGSCRYPIHSTGASWDRTEKASIVAANPVVLDHLRVCYERPELGENCGECEKCVRTKLNFYASGVRNVPALKSPLTVDDIRTKCALNPRIVHLYSDPLEKGSWQRNDPIRAEVEALVRRYVEEHPDARQPLLKQKSSKTLRAKRQLQRLTAPIRALAARMGLRRA